MVADLQVSPWGLLTKKFLENTKKIEKPILFNTVINDYQLFYKLWRSKWKAKIFVYSIEAIAGLECFIKRLIIVIPSLVGKRIKYL